MRPRLLATLRLSWALVRRSKARSALIALLVAIPVCAGVFVATTVRTVQLSPAQAATRYLGHADAIAQVSSYLHLDPRTSAIGVGPSLSGDQKQTLDVPTSRPQRVSTSVNLSVLLPAGARAIPFGWERTSSVAAGGRTTEAHVLLADIADPMARGIYDIQSGSAPRGGADVAVTSALADQLRLHPGSTVSVDGNAFHVTGVVRKPAGLNSRDVVGPPASVGRLGQFHAPFGVPNPSWLISFPGGHAPNLHDRLAAEGVIYETRFQWEHPTGLARARLWDLGGGTDPEDVVIRSTIVVVGILEILLLTGTAFAVGARRQIQQLGVLRALGADQGDVRRTVLGQGVLLGFLGSVVGALAGIVFVPLTSSLIEGITARELGPLDVPALVVLGAVLAGTAAALVAALLPARFAGRLPVLDMLRQEFPTSARPVRIPRWCIVAGVLGVSLMAFATVEFHNSPRRLEAQSGSPDGTLHNFYSTQNHQTLWTVLMSIGAGLSIAGLARLCPALVARIGQLGPRLPFTLRLPVRDVGRQWHRTAPVTAAIATVLAGTVLVLFIASSTNVRDRHSYVPMFPSGTVSVETHGQPTLLDDFTNTVARSLHADAAGTAAWVTSRTTFNHLGVQTPACRGGHPTELGCDFGLPLTAVDSSYVDAVVGHHVPKAAAMLAQGGAVVLRPNLAQGGYVSLAKYTLSHAGVPITTPMTQLPALVLPPVPATQRVPDVLISPATAAAHHWKTEPAFGLVRPTQLPSSSQLARVKHSLGDRVTLRAERGYQPKYGTLVLALIAAAAFVLLAGTTVTVALSMAESRADMAILRAVGASGVRRRLYAMGQAGTVGIIGVVLGLLLGSAVGLALQIGSRDYPISVPLGWLAATATVSVGLAVVMAGILTTSRAPLPRRVA